MKITNQDVKRMLDDYPHEIKKLKSLIRKGVAVDNSLCPIKKFSDFKKKLHKLEGNYFTIAAIIEETLKNSGIKFETQFR